MWHRLNHGMQEILTMLLNNLTLGVFLYPIRKIGKKAICFCLFYFTRNFSKDKLKKLTFKVFIKNLVIHLNEINFIFNISTRIV